MIVEKKLLDGGINADDSIRLIGGRQSLNMMNCRMGVSSTGRSTRIENVPGTTLLNSGLLPAGTNQCIGTAVDEGRRRLIFFNWNSNGNHGIYLYDNVLKANYTVLLNANVTGGLAFNKLFRIDRNAKVIGDLLYWTDNLNEPRCINIESALVTNNAGYVTSSVPYVFPLEYTSTTMIKRPPCYALTASKVIDGTFANNYTGPYSFQFFYRYVFYDYQISALSPVSNLIPCNYKDDKYNAVDITVPLSEKVKADVSKVQICVQFGNAGKAFIIKIYDKNIVADNTAINNHNAGTTALSFRFYNDRAGIPLDSVSQVNFQDLVPLTIGTFELAKNRLFAANNKKGYTAPLTTSLTVSVANTSTPSFPPTATGYSDQNGFNTPTKVGQTYIVGAPIVTANYRIANQDYTDGNSYPNWATWTDNACLYQDLSNQITTLAISGNGVIWNPDRDSQISFYFYIVTSTGPVVKKKIATYYTKKNISLALNVNFQVSVPALAKVFLIINPDLGVTGFNDNNFKFGLLNIYVINQTSISYPPPHFKTNGYYRLSISFYDRYRRKSGIVTNETIKITIPKRAYADVPANIVTWLLSNTSALTEIPDWAYYYQILITKNQHQLSFIQSVAQSTWYAVKDPVTGVISYTQDTYGPDSFAVAVNIAGLSDIGVGYTFNDGDLIDLWSDGGIVTTLTVLGVNGNWVHCEKQNLGSLGTNSLWKFEIYTPNKGSLIDNYYEATPVYDITNPTTGTRAYSTLTGTLAGDTYFIIRSDSVNVFYQAETMNPNDKTWSIWDLNIGWINVIDTIGQKQLQGNISFTDTYIQGTQVNGLNKFQPLNIKDIGSDSGKIQKLQLVNKIQEQGTVMLVVCTNDVLSAYLGEVQLVGASGNASLATTSDVIGTINALRGNYGTLNPESVVAYLGDAFWFDAINGVMVQYSNNGTFPISNYKMQRFFGNYGRDYRNMSASDISAINGFSHIPTCINPFNRELMVTTPALIYPSYATLLPSYTGIPAYASSINNRFDPYDKLGKTLCFNYDQNQWNENFEFTPEWFEIVGSDVFGFKNGSVYLMESDKVNYNTFFGTQYPVRICFTPNNSPSVIKDVISVSVEGNVVPDYTVVYCLNPNEQITDLIAGDYKAKEGVKYAALLRDRLSPNAVGTSEQKLYSGDIMKDPAPMIMMEFQKYNSLMWVDFINVGYIASRGHQAIAGG